VESKSGDAMSRQTIGLSDGAADGYVIPLGPVNLVCAVAGHGMVGCGAFDVAALDRFGYAAARVRRADGPVADVDDLLAAEVTEANEAARRFGVAVGMSGRAALEQLR
jgi:uncharacterized protein YunC (DUF1805 family)